MSSVAAVDPTSQSSRYPAIVILDFGSQYSELIARRVRETEVFSLVMGYTTTAEELKAIQPKGIILSAAQARCMSPGHRCVIPVSGTWAFRYSVFATACS